MAKAAMGQNVTIDQIKFDRTNANKGTERGRYAIESSMREFGFADAGTLDRNNVIIGGNKRTEVAGEIGMDEAIIIDVDGTKPVFIRRNDLDMYSTDDDKARRLAYALNRSQQLSLEWDAEQVLADLNAGVDLSGLFYPDELDAIINGMDGEQDGAGGGDEPYSREIKSPVYEPKNEKPELSALFDDSRTRQLVGAIDAADMPEDVKAFLRIAAQRHTVLHFNRIADYYAHAPADVQRLMEDSALIIIDFKRAIELGYVELTKNIAELVRDEYGE